MPAHLAELSIGDRARVLGYSDPQAAYARHLTSLGLIPGTELRVVRVAPLGDPIEIECRGARIVIRPREAGLLELERR
jgi:ferrous iron transport protein A